jgi:predicted nuclease of predicted toxin-antitoxin system
MPWVPLGVAEDRYSRRLMAEVKGNARFLLDNNVDADILAYLDGIGIGAHMLPYALVDRPDDEVLAEAWRQDRVLLTHDTDFLDTTLHPPESCPGVVVMPGGSGNAERYYPTIGAMLKLIKPYRALWRQTYVHIQDSRMIVIKGVNATHGIEIEPWALRFDDRGNPFQWLRDNGDS